MSRSDECPTCVHVKEQIAINSPKPNDMHAINILVVL